MKTIKRLLITGILFMCSLSTAFGTTYYQKTTMSYLNYYDTASSYKAHTQVAMYQTYTKACAGIRNGGGECGSLSTYSGTSTYSLVFDSSSFSNHVHFYMKKNDSTLYSIK